jgi:hypothetical protein
MNKKQKAVVILWALQTGLWGWSCFITLDASYSSGKSWRSISPVLALWAAITLALSALWWVFQDPKKQDSTTD